MKGRPMLRRGVPVSDTVRELHDLLRGAGLDPDTTDGDFGDGTEQAVKSFQRTRGLADDGVAGRDTCAALDGHAAPASLNNDQSAHSGAENPDPTGQIEAWGYEDGVRGFQESFAWDDIAVDGEAGPETARAVQKVVDAGGLLSPHFHMDEFRSHGNQRVRIRRETIRSCEATRSNLGGPLGILSGYRDHDHNIAIGGAPDSQHVKGTAVDPSPYLSRSVIEGAGWAGVGVSEVVAPGQISHLDRRDVFGTSPGEFGNN